MPFLRFSRDERGYENTYVLHTFRRDGRSRPRVLYWFRTPPNVSVGRLPLDEDAIRAVEEANPDLTFDWTKMLKVKPPPLRGDERDGRGERGRRKSAAAARGESTRARRSDRSSTKSPPPEEEEAVEPVTEVEASERHPVVALVGDEGLARLRARYAEIQARITEKATDPAAREELRAKAETLNPDTWTTPERAADGLERFEAEAEELKKVLGPRPRRSRRGGRRHRRSQVTPPADAS